MFNYFLPAVDKEQVAPNERLDHDLLRGIAKPLVDALADVHRVPQHASVMNVQRGPSGTAGTLIAPVMKHRGVPSVFYDGKLQEWREALGGRYWLGAMKDAKPIPQDLERWEVLGGAEVLDDVGQDWAVPIARAPHWGQPYGTLPQSFTIDPVTSEPLSHLQPSHEWLWELSGKICDWYLSHQQPPETATPAEIAAHKPRSFGELVKYAGQILGVNYRLSPVELNWLHGAGVALLTQRTVHAICQASYGWQLRDEAKKKPTDASDPQAVSLSRSTTGDETLRESPGIDLAAAH